MNRFFRPSLVLLVAMLSLAGCKKDSDTPTGLVGKWKLTNRQCYCVRTPLPDEHLTFTDLNFTFYRSGQPEASGTYAPATTVPCGATTPISVTRFTYSNGTQRDFMVMVSDRELVLDDGIQRACLADADVVSTYARLPE